LITLDGRPWIGSTIAAPPDAPSLDDKPGAVRLHLGETLGGVAEAAAGVPDARAVSARLWNGTASCSLSPLAGGANAHLTTKRDSKRKAASQEREQRMRKKKEAQRASSRSGLRRVDSARGSRAVVAWLRRGPDKA
jgi:hypothetical protein